MRAHCRYENTFGRHITLIGAVPSTFNPHHHFRIVGRNDDIDVTMACKGRRCPQRVKSRVPFYLILSQWEFQKLHLNYLESVFVKFRENFAAVVICQYLLLIVLTKF